MLLKTSTSDSLKYQQKTGGHVSYKRELWLTFTLGTSYKRELGLNFTLGTSIESSSKCSQNVTYSPRVQFKQKKSHKNTEKAFSKPKNHRTISCPPLCDCTTEEFPFTGGAMPTGFQSMWNGGHYTGFNVLFSLFMVSSFLQEKFVSLHEWKISSLVHSLGVQWMGAGGCRESVGVCNVYSCFEILSFWIS